MNIGRISIAGATAVALAGCAAGSLKDIRAEHAGMVEVSVDENYQSVYRRVVDIQRDCHETHMGTAQVSVRSDLYTDIQRGDIAVAMTGGLGTMIYQLTEIHAGDQPDTSDVDIYYSLSTWEGSAKGTAAFIRGDVSGCHIASNESDDDTGNANSPALGPR